jgi:hypothetical protein
VCFVNRGERRRPYPVVDKNKAAEENIFLCYKILIDRFFTSFYNDRYFLFLFYFYF